MFHDAPPVQIEAIFPEIELLLDFDPGLVEKGGKCRRHRVREIDRTIKATDRCLRIGGQARRKTDRKRSAALEQTTAR
jgi:hypothetical protein